MRLHRLTCSVVAFWVLAVPALCAADPLSRSATELVTAFRQTPVFWKQYQVAQQIVSLKEPSVLPELSGYLSDQDRHTRANAAFIFAALGDMRGLNALLVILNDQSYRPMGQAYMRFECLIPQHETRCPYDPQLQIVSDRYYAATVLGDLKDPRAVPALISVLTVPSVNLGAIWALAKIDDKRAVEPLIALLARNDPTVQVTTIRALEKMDAKESIPALYRLVNDKDRSHVDDLIPVGEAARQALAQLGAPWSWFAYPGGR